MKHAVIAIAVLVSGDALAAVGCTLSNPAEDLKYLFPDMTSYKEELKEFTRIPDGERLYRAFAERLKSDLDPMYETVETPYTLYSVFRGETKIGVVHGVNVPGKGGVIQVFLSTDPDKGEISRLFFQRLESPAAQELRSKEFRQKFEGLALGDFYKHDYYATAGQTAADRVAKILSKTSDPDAQAALRGVRKNLVLLDFFVYGRRYEPFFEKARQAIEKKTTKGKP